MKLRKALFSIFLAWTVLMLACNLPVRREGDLSPSELRSTLEALKKIRIPQSTSAPGRVTDAPPITPFAGLATATPALSEDKPEEPPKLAVPGEPFTYYTQAGDTLPALSARFGVNPQEITTIEPLSMEGLLPVGIMLSIPNRLGQPPFPSALLPDSEIIHSPSTIGFSTDEYVRQAGGYLQNYEETVHGELLKGAQIVQRVAELTSTNPRVLLALLEFRSGWVRGQPETEKEKIYPIGYQISGQEGLYRELSIAANQLNAGYYGWRRGTLTELQFPDPVTVRLSPTLNAGTASLQRLFSQFYPLPNWQEVLYGEENFPRLVQDMFGDPWERARVVEPLFSADLSQPDLELPFLPGERWALTGGPHYSWNAGSPRGALDFAPITKPIGCQVSPAWVTASAPGVVVRTGEGILVLDLDGDGFEQTGWVLFYLHMAETDRLNPGTMVQADQKLGHPSCEGGQSTGTHIHMARKYNGEWITSDQPLPFLLSGWQAVEGEKNYLGTLVKGDRTVSANPGGNRTSVIIR